MLMSTNINLLGGDPFGLMLICILYLSWYIIQIHVHVLVLISETLLIRLQKKENSTKKVLLFKAF